MRSKVHAAARRYAPEIVSFLRELIGTPSESASEGAVVARIATEMRDLGYDEVKIDDFGNVLGRVGDGPRVIAIDGHVDTASVGDRASWSRDPYRGVIDDGILYGRGASDQLGGVAAAVYGARIAKEMGLLDGVSLWVTGTVMEEDCDGLSWQYLLGEKVLVPEVVVLTEATNLAVYRGHCGRIELELCTEGRAAYSPAVERDDNAVYKMIRVLAALDGLNTKLASGADPFLGKGSLTVCDIRSSAPSRCAVADRCTLYLDRRLTRGETREDVLRQLSSLPEVLAAGATVRISEYSRPTYTGHVRSTEKYYPTWVLEEDHAAVRAGALAAKSALGREPEIGKWGFSTNGVATCGMFGVPTIGFGPANEAFAHTTDDQCPIDHLPLAAAFYALFPAAYGRALGPSGGRSRGSRADERKAFAREDFGR